ncbi:glycogen debranching enzyme GlgX [Bifidobacterium gallicum DSM 20093 = LMG 11596]|nr:glycogen debranching enzyme GlgX [Bifidobacterium gallicum DSM 20093 = LMG 11596]
MGMQLQKLHRYATRPGLFFTQDGGADIIVRSETAEAMWLSVLEPLDGPSEFYLDAIRLPDDSAAAFVEPMMEHRVVTRRVPGYAMRETLFRMDGPNYGLWYVHLPKAWDGMMYGFRANGVWDPRHGLMFNPYKFLIDPYGKGIEGTAQLDPAAFAYECEIRDGRVVGDCYGRMSTLDSLGKVPYSVAIDDRDVTKHDRDPVHPHVQWRKTVIYELHVKGFTARAPWLAPELRGTYAGLAHPKTLSYLQELGVTSIELMPIHAKQPELFLQQQGKRNYWGYSTLNYFSPEPSYATKKAQQQGATAVRQEVIDMVKALHQAGFEVIMDVVFNHTCEGGNEGMTVSWRGLDNLSTYRQSAHPGHLEDTTGCGNTLDFTDTHNVMFAVDSLSYWAKRIGIDGFRFDLAVSTARLNGSFTPYHPFLYALRSDQLLGNLKLIMEPWDVGPDGWRTGQFLTPFSEWNDRFRDTARSFWVTDVAARLAPHASMKAKPMVSMQEIATRLCGSADVFATNPGRGASSSINFVTAHDGFTLADLVSYERKHNEANGEQNRDGASHNHSANFGVEGPSNNALVLNVRERAAMNLLGMLMLSLGTPMMLAGDEFGNSQQGNNNAYCLDDETTWLDWSWIHGPDDSPERRRMRSLADLIALRKTLDIYHHEDFFTRLTQLGLKKRTKSRVEWFLPDGSTPRDTDWHSDAIHAFTMRLASGHERSVAIVVNSGADDLDMVLPADCEWRMLWSSAQVHDDAPFLYSRGTDANQDAQDVEDAQDIEDRAATVNLKDGKRPPMAHDGLEGVETRNMKPQGAKEVASANHGATRERDMDQPAAELANRSGNDGSDGMVWRIPANSISLLAS